MKKIYIVGVVGSGKRTFALKLSEKLNIKMYELDKVVFNDLCGNIKRSDIEIREIFDSIISDDTWILEDVGRSIFIDGIVNADVVYYIYLDSFTIYFRCIKRWIKQKLGFEKYNYKPTISSLMDMLKWAKDGIKTRKEKIKYISENNDNLIILNKKDIKNILRSL